MHQHTKQLWCAKAIKAVVATLAATPLSLLAEWLLLRALDLVDC